MTAKVIPITRSTRWAKILRALGAATLEEARALRNAASARSGHIARLVRELEQIACPHPDVEEPRIDRPGRCKRCGCHVLPPKPRRWERCSKRLHGGTGPLTFARCARRAGHPGSCKFNPRRRRDWRAARQGAGLA